MRETSWLGTSIVRLLARRLLRRLVVWLSTAVVVMGGTTSLTAIPALAAVRGYVSSSSADMFWCTSDASTFCTQTRITTVAAGTAVNLVCWRDDRRPFTNASPRWFYGYLDNGIEGWLWAPQIGGQASTPWCQNINWVTTADWALGHLGQVYASAPDASVFTKADWGEPYAEWSGDCAKFAYLAWNKSTARGNAIDIFNYYNARGQIHRYPSRPPRGALVFWNQTQFGHVAVSIGNWQAVGTQGTDGQRLPIAAYSVLDSRAPYYLGWAMPQAPTTPQNPS